MKKNILIIISLFFLTIVPAQAVRLGIKTGVNLSKASFSWNALNPDNFTGFQVGPIMEFHLPIIGLGMDAAILYSEQGFKLEGETQKTQSIDIPLNLKYKFELLNIIGIYGTAGPYASFRISGDNFSVPDITDQFKYKTFGAGLNFGFGVEILKHLQIGANYQLALTDDYSVNNYSVKMKTWSVTAAYFF